MKEMFLNKSLSMIKRQYDYDSDTLDRIKYGLEIIYITITKITVLLIVSILINAFKETLIILVLVNFLRMFAYGLHAKKSWHCYVSSILALVVLPHVFINFEFSIIQKVIISLLAFISFVLFAPADTHKRPLINKAHRKKLKLSTLLVSSIYITLIFILKSNYYINLLILALIIQSFIINPFIYKIFDLPYDNYKSYKKDCN